jgi:hypothetical protein
MLVESMVVKLSNRRLQQCEIQRQDEEEEV